MEKYLVLWTAEYSGSITIEAESKEAAEKEVSDLIGDGRLHGSLSDHTVDAEIE